MDDLMAVSYTHLDVYKRQMQEIEESREDLRESDGYEDIKRKGLVDETEW